MEHININVKHNTDKTTNNGEMKNIYKIPDNYSTLQSMSEIKKCVEKISSLQKVLKDSSSNSRSSFDQVDRSIITHTKIVAPAIATKGLNIRANNTEQMTDGNYFLEILRSEQTRLIKKAEEIETDIEILAQEEKMYEDVLGLLRSTSGKSRLLVSQKMKQFEGLCYSNLNQIPSEKFQTTNEDLQGFWDMVKLQIDHVDSLFDEIKLLKNNNWILDDSLSIEKDVVIVKSSTKKPTVSKVKPAQDINGTKKQAARRRELLELKRKAKTAMQNQDGDKPEDSNKLEFFF